MDCIEGTVTIAMDVCIRFIGYGSLGHFKRAEARKILEELGKAPLAINGAFNSGGVQRIQSKRDKVEKLYKKYGKLKTDIQKGGYNMQFDDIRSKLFNEVNGLNTDKVYTPSMLKDDLKEQVKDSLTEAQFRGAWEMAWEEGHSSGLDEVFRIFIDVVDVVTAV